MACMLDTVHCVHLLMHSPEVTPRAPIGDCRVSVVVAGELQAGAWLGPAARQGRNRQALLDFLSAVHVCPLDGHVAQAYALLRAGSEHAGSGIGVNDWWVAAHALALELPLVTYRPQRLAGVHGLVTDNWLLARD